jgi:hypothetical protein
MTMPWTASVFTTEMKPPTRVYSVTTRNTMPMAGLYGISRKTSTRLPIPL